MPVFIKGIAKCDGPRFYAYLNQGKCDDDATCDILIKVGEITDTLPGNEWIRHVNLTVAEHPEGWSFVCGNVSPCAACCPKCVQNGGRAKT